MDDNLPFHFLEVITVSTFDICYVGTIFSFVVVSAILCHHDCSMCGQLLAVYSCYHHYCDTIFVSVVLLAHIKKYQAVGSTW